MNYEIQILNHNIRRTNMIIMIDLLMFKKNRRKIFAKKTFESHVIQSIKFKKIFKLTNSNIDNEYMQLYKFNRIC